jgi:mycothiol synthase
VIAVRRAESDADLEAWRRVRIAVVPNERAQTVDELREALTPTQLYLLAELDGRVAGSGVAGRSDLAGQGFLFATRPPRGAAARSRHGAAP